MHESVKPSPKPKNIEIVHVGIYLMTGTLLLYSVLVLSKTKKLLD